ncbi:cyclase family protein [Microaceticoccus formicicus]|uniref:cyclase family protein n=1 Tax=Microaceticoccus formicicus TaxID=3118105 RepID=UPI003CCFFA76|nr:cyclase family protein [Peptoniphilaceae bacterium AMB_02]
MTLNLWNDLIKLKETCEIVDLSHPVAAETPHWAGFDAVKERVVYNFKEHRFLAKEYTIVGQYATHIDAPVHFYEPGRYLHELELSDAILPLVVIDKSAEAKENANYAINKQDIIEFEKVYGEIPEGSFVALRTDWCKRVENFDNIDEDGVSNYPGWSLEACKYLIEERKVKAIGHETSDTDASMLSRESGWLDVETYVLSKDIYQVELMANLDKMPAVGGVIIVGYPNIVNGTGFTARCIGIRPKLNE